MKNYLLIAVLTAAFAGQAWGKSDPAAEKSVQSSVQSLLDAYSSKDLSRALALIDEQNILVLGSDLTEVANTRESVTNLLRADFALWNRASFGAPLYKSVCVEPEVASAAFDVPFTMVRSGGGADTIILRFLTVWHWNGHQWLLTQSLNSVPTVGQSAKDILQHIGAEGPTN